nr:MAG TPA: hypothetical protein [Caudoviricetes sp.]
MSFIRHRRATSPNKFECRNVYGANRSNVAYVKKDPIFTLNIPKIRCITP